MDAQKVAALRNRENQRRSRARRKDYIQELEERLRQYEIAGVTATAEVQAAARKVSDENLCLRSLLGVHGVDNGRIEDFLRTGDPPFISRAISGQQFEEKPSHSHPKPKQAGLSIQHRYGAGTKPLPTCDITTSTQPAQPHTTTFVSPNPVSEAGSSPASSPSETAINPDRVQTNRRTSFAPPPSASRIRSSPLTGRDQASSGGRDEISCLAAAEIIAGMRGHDTPEDVWSELGCGSSGRCMVKNMAMFQIMDQ